MNADGFATSGRDLHAVCAVLHKEIITGATRSATGGLKDPTVVNWKDTRKPIPQDRNTVEMPPRDTTLFWTGTGPSVPPTSIGMQKIDVPRQTIIPQEVRNAEPLDTYINRIPSKHGYRTLSWSTVIGSIFTNKSRDDVYARCWMNLVSHTVLSKSPNFLDFGLSSVNTMDELGSIFAPTIRIRLITHGSNWLLHSHFIIEPTLDIVSRTKAKNHYNFKHKFETRRDKLLDQDLGHQNDSMSRSPLEHRRDLPVLHYHEIMVI